MFQPLHHRTMHFVLCLFLLTTLGFPRGAGAQPEAEAAATSDTKSDTKKSSQHGFFVPFTPVPGQGTPLITVRLNGKTDATFAVDTGTGNCLISEALVAKLGSVTHPALLANGKPLLLNGKQPQAITLTSLQIGGKSGPLNIQPLKGEVLVVPDQQLRGLTGRLADGMIGSDLLEAFAVVLDFPRHMMTLCYPGSLTPGEARYLGFNEARGTILTLSRNEDETYSVPVRLMNGTVSRQADLLVDTGAQTTQIPRLMAQDLFLVPLRQRPVLSFADNYTANEAQVHTLQLGDFQIAEPHVLYATKNDDIVGLGLDILSSYKVLLDFPARKMYLQPALPSINVGPSETMKPSAVKTTAP